MGATVFQIAGGGGVGRPPLVKGVGTKRLGKGRVKTLVTFAPKINGLDTAVTATPVLRPQNLERALGGGGGDSAYQILVRHIFCSECRSSTKFGKFS